jgi:hypothetical protein
MCPGRGLRLGLAPDPLLPYSRSDEKSAKVST